MKRLYILLLFILVVVPFFALGTGSALFYRVFYALIFLTAGSVLWCFLNLYRLEARIQRPHGRFKVGDTLESTIELHNPTFPPKLMLEVNDLTELPGHPTSSLISLKPYGTARWTSTAVLLKRGVYTLGHLAVTSTDIFGIFSRRKLFPSSEEVVIYPAFMDLPWLYVPYKELMEEGRTRQPTVVVTPMASSVREYMDGDTEKHIHWPTTARRGQLMSKQFERGMENRVWVVMDLDQTVHAGQEQEIDNTEEYVITIGASVVARFIKEGWAVGLLAQGDRWYFLPARGNISLDRYLDTLARARAFGSVSLSGLLEGNQSLLAPAPFALVIITPSLDTRWVYTLRSPQMRGVVASVVLVDVSSFGKQGDPALIMGLLKEQGVIGYVVRRGDSLATALDYRSAMPKEASPL